MYNHSFLIRIPRTLLHLYHSCPLLIGCQSYTYTYITKQINRCGSGEPPHDPEVKEMQRDAHTEKKKPITTGTIPSYLLCYA